MTGDLLLGTVRSSGRTAPCTPRRPSPWRRRLSPHRMVLPSTAGQSGRASRARRLCERGRELGARAYRELSTLMLLVLETDNEPRVRDGYISLGTRGHARAR